MGISNQNFWGWEKQIPAHRYNSGRRKLGSLRGMQPILLGSSGIVRLLTMRLNARYELPLEPSSKLCRLAEPHSNAFVDLDGDCLPGELVSNTAPSDAQGTC